MSASINMGYCEAWKRPMAMSQPARIYHGVPACVVLRLGA